MKKKVALVLIMVMFANMIAWADDGEGATGTIIVILALIGLGAVLIISTVTVAEADAPDDGVRLASMQTVSIPKTPFSSFIKVLQHVELGKNQDNDVYVGLRFQF